MRGHVVVGVVGVVLVIGDGDQRRQQRDGTAAPIDQLRLRRCRSREGISADGPIDAWSEQLSGVGALRARSDWLDLGTE